MLSTCYLGNTMVINPKKNSAPLLLHCYFQTFGYEDIKRNGRWWQHNWQLSNDNKLHMAQILSTDEDEMYDRKVEKSYVKQMPLEAFVKTLGHKKRPISFLNSNQYKHVWNLLRHVIVNHATINIEQVIT